MTDCPTADRLDRWASELLPLTEQEAVARHVNDCSYCQAALHRLTEPEPSGSATVRLRPAEPAGAFLDRLREQAPQPPLPTVPGYDILGPLGRGGMGVVYKARHAALDRVVALKMISAAGHVAPDVRARFVAEARAVARLRHPDIVQVHEVGEADGVAYFSMEYIEGGSLADALDGRPRPPRTAAGLVRTVAGAVEYAHRQGVVHRDLKPANILLAAGGTPKLTDFGIAKRLGATDGLTRTGEIIGTPRYMAPEQAGGEANRVGPATDVYALGVILYELLTGRPPHRGADTIETLEFVRTQEPVPPRRLVPAVPRNLEAVCLKCLEKNPARRYPTAAELAADLDRYLRGEPVAARTTTALERLVEAIGHSEHDRQLRAWGTAVLALAPAMGLPTMAVTGLALWAPRLVWYVPALGAAVVLVSLATALWLRRHRPGSGVGPAVRQFLAILVGHALAVGAVLAAAPLVFDAGDPLDLLKLGPFVAIVTGQMYYSLGAAYWGRFYLAGVACLVLAVPMALVPVWGPLAFGLLLTVIFVAWGLHLRALGAEDPDHAAG